MRANDVAPEPRPWKSGLACLVFLGPFFFATYGLANWAAAQRSSVPAIVFGWEHAIPFLPWTIVPYWLIDVLYAISLLLCANRAELRTHVTRLIFVQIVAVLCFLVFPLRYTFERPAVEGLLAAMFAALEAFDQPYNQAPSLHAALLIVLWPVYLRALPKAWHAAVHAVALLIGVSILTTGQHHFIDLPSGIWLGCFAVWLFRDDDTAGSWRLNRCKDGARRRLAAYYAGGTVLLCGLALVGGGVWLVLLWPAASLALVGTVYLFADGRAYGKVSNGSFPATAWVLLGPYFIASWINAWLWTQRVRSADEVSPGVHLGSLVRSWAHAGDRHTTIVDVCADVASPRIAAVHVIPMLDLVAPSPEELQAAALAIDAARERGPVLVACALGFGRGAAAVAAWMLHAHVTPTVDAAVEKVRAARPAVVLGPHQLEALRTWQRASFNALGVGNAEHSAASHSQKVIATEQTTS